jgi:hypothetical protein
MTAWADIQENLARISASSAFSNSEGLRELLQYTVTEALEGRAASLKESVLGVAVFGRKPGLINFPMNCRAARDLKTGWPVESGNRTHTHNPQLFQLIHQSGIDP